MDEDGGGGDSTAWEVSSSARRRAYCAWRVSSGGNSLAKPPPCFRLDAWQCRLVMLKRCVNEDGGGDGGGGGDGAAGRAGGAVEGGDEQRGVMMAA